MKTKALTLLLAAVVGVSACQTGRQTPPPPSPQPDPGTGTAAPQPNPNPEPPVPPIATPVAQKAPALAAPASVVPMSVASSPARPPASAIPDQPVIAVDVPAPAAPDRPHREILRLKQSGASDETLLDKIRRDDVNYALTTAEVIELRGAGISEAIVAAMLRSGQTAAPSSSAR